MVELIEASTNVEVDKETGEAAWCKDNGTDKPKIETLNAPVLIS